MSEVWSSGFVSNGGAITSSDLSDGPDVTAWTTVTTITSEFLEGYGTRMFIPLSTSDCRVRVYRDGSFAERHVEQVEEHELRQDPPVYEDDDAAYDGVRYISPSGRLHPDDDVKYSRFMFGNLIEDGREHHNRDFPWPFRKDGRTNHWYVKKVDEAETVAVDVETLVASSGSEVGTIYVFSGGFA